MSLEWDIGSAAYARVNPLRVAMEATLAPLAGPYRPSSSADLRVHKRLSLYLSWQGDYRHTCSMCSKGTWLAAWSMLQVDGVYPPEEEEVALEIAQQLIRLTGRPELLGPLPEYDDGPAGPGN